MAMEPSSTGPASLPAVLEDRLGAEVREGVRTLDGLGAAAPREAAALDELSRLNQLARQRQAERESLFASLADDVPSLEAALLETRRELAEAQLQRSGEAALAQQLQQRLAVRDAQAHEQAAELRRLQARPCTAPAPPLHHPCTAPAPPPFHLRHRHCCVLRLLQAELEAEQARRLAAEGSSASQAAVSSGMGLKARKLEEQLAQAVQLHGELAAAADQAAERAARAEALAAREQQAARRAAAELGALREQSAAEAAARVALEGAKTALSKQLAEAQRLCAAAGEECARVRKRNEQVERQLAAEAERRKATGVDQVLDDLEQLEGLVGRMPGEGIVESKREGGRVPSFM